MFNKLSFTLLIDKRPEGNPHVFSVDIGTGASDIDALKITTAMMNLYGADNVTLMRNVIATEPVEVTFKAEGEAA